MPDPLILIVDDDLRMRQLIRDTLASEGINAVLCSDGAEASEMVLRQTTDLIITDLMMPQIDGMELLNLALQANPDCLVVVITGYGSIESAVQAIKNGAYDYLQKPFEPDQLLLVVQRALVRLRLQNENRQLRQQVAGCQTDELLGASKQMTELKALITRIAPFDTTVLIQGDTGTGKELAARMIHRLSGRRDQRFLPINCGALPETLLESELFGHARGAFTSADRDKKGLLESADHGTLFLDEINTTSPAFQVKLLRVLQEGSFIRVGDHEPRSVDLRVIAASNATLEKEVQAGRFRSDLFYRLNVVTITLPPLHDRQGDIGLLAHYFLTRYARQYGVQLTSIAPEALQRLRSHHWPGNVRELENIIERAVIMADGNELQPQHLPRFSVSDTPLSSSSDQELLPMAEVERRHIIRVLKATAGHRGKASKLLGISLASLWRKVKQYGL